MRYAPRWTTFETLFTYALSAWIFSLVYLGTVPDDAGFERITYFTYDRARLNEKPIFLTTHLVLLGIYQGVRHLYSDIDRLSLGTAQPSNGDSSKATGEDGHVSTQMRRFRDQLPKIVVHSLHQSVMGLLLSASLYPLLLRDLLWRVNMTMLRPLYSLPRTNVPPANLPYSPSTLLRCLAASVMVMFAWTAANTAFSLLLVKSPLKNGKPLTADAKDPNGSLLNGLKNKKLSIKCFAMWELAYIARDFPDRRKAIFEDMDRKDGPMWSQVYKICLDTLHTLSSNIDAYTAPPAPATTPQQAETALGDKPRTSAPPKEDHIFAPLPSNKSAFRTSVSSAFQNAALAGPGGPPASLSPVAKRTLHAARSRLLEAAAPNAEIEVTPSSFFRELALKYVLSSPLAGYPFRQTRRRRLASAVLGSPYGEPSLYVNAASAVSGLAVSSLREDRYGHVQRDVASLIRELTSLGEKLNAFVNEGGMGKHWTDVVELEGEDKCEEVEEVVNAVKHALKRVIVAFEPYARDLRLTRGEVKKAREVAGLEQEVEVREVMPEMVQIR